MSVHLRIMHKFDHYLRSFTRADGSETFQPVSFPPLDFAEVEIESIDKGLFSFLNKTVDLGSPIDWLPASQTKLWIYNLHFARELARQFQTDNNDKYFQLFKKLADQWILACPVATAVAWDAYPVSLRLNNWLRAYTVFEANLNEDKDFAARLRASIYNQALYLEKHLELQLQNNHLLENGRTLWLVSIFFSGKDADRWRSIGSGIIWTGLDDNFFADGGHDELSPMYHQIMLDMYREIAGVAYAQQLDTPAHLNERLEKMQYWLRNVLHPDGGLSLFNDSAINICAPPATSIDSNMPANNGLTALPDSGYIMLRDNDRANLLIFDAGLMGADHRCGHSHCDILSYELSIAGQRVVVDSGVSDYFENPDMRHYYRSTRAHNTVVVDNEEQSQIWDTFRVAHRARPTQEHWATDENVLWASASHTGYERLKHPVTHNRKVCYVDNAFWLIIDKMTCSDHHPANKATDHAVESFIHFHPSANTVSLPEFGASTTPGLISIDSLNVQIVPWGYDSINTYSGNSNPIQGWHADEFGGDVKNAVWGLESRLRDTCWSGYVIWADATPIDLQVVSDESKLRLTINASNKMYSMSVTDSAISTEISSVSGSLPAERTPTDQ